MDTNRRSDLESSSTRRHLPGDGRLAFTLTELLVVLATLGILAVLLLPALASSTQPASAKAFQCLNNMRQMAQAWMLYAEDNHDRLAINTDPSTRTGPPLPPGWCAGIEDWTLANANTNIANLTSDQYALLAPYAGRRYQIYHCPADVFVSPNAVRVRFQQVGNTACEVSQ